MAFDQTHERRLFPCGARATSFAAAISSPLAQPAKDGAQVRSPSLIDAWPLKPDPSFCAVTPLPVRSRRFPARVDRRDAVALTQCGAATSVAPASAPPPAPAGESGPIGRNSGQAFDRCQLLMAWWLTVSTSVVQARTRTGSGRRHRYVGESAERLLMPRSQASSSHYRPLHRRAIFHQLSWAHSFGPDDSQARGTDGKRGVP